MSAGLDNGDIDFDAFNLRFVVRGADFCLVEFCCSDVCGFDLCDVYVSAAGLYGSDIGRSDFCLVEFCCSHFRSSEFNCADVRGSDVGCAHVYRADYGSSDNCRPDHGRSDDRWAHNCGTDYGSSYYASSGY